MGIVPGCIRVIRPRGECCSLHIIVVIIIIQDISFLSFSMTSSGACIVQLLDWEDLAKDGACTGASFQGKEKGNLEFTRIVC
jgi:hypothetical protein